LKEYIFKRYTAVIIVFFAIVSTASGQGGIKNNNQRNWQLLDLTKDSVFGISSDLVLTTILKDFPASPVIVAIIDGGIDTTHEDLKNILWTNPNEIPGNGKDDDKNGYIDDIHGWSFLGSSKGSFLYDNKDLIRQLRSETLKDRTSDKVKQLWKEVNKKNGDLEKAIAELKKKKGIIADIGKALGKSSPSENELRNYHYRNFDEEEVLIEMIKAYSRPDGFDGYLQELNGNLNKYDYQLKYFFNYDYNPREGKEYKKQFYGTGDVQGPQPFHGSHVAGIAGADRTNNLGINGVCSSIQIMSVRAVPTGDFLEKDLAMAIRYAADNGAKVINMSTGKITINDQKILDDAVKYAMGKDVLFVHACGNDGKELFKGEELYPRKRYLDGGESEAWLEVGGSGPIDNEGLLGFFSNYGKDVVDVFAPGLQIESTIPGNHYMALNGTSMAAPVVAGLAAMIRSYYPKLSAKQVKDIIFQSVSKVNHSVKTARGEIIPFSQTCASGGIVNAVNAFKLAESMISLK